MTGENADDLRRENEALRRRVEELEAADRRKDEFLAMLAHELRGPLAPVRNSLDIVRLRGRERRQGLRQAWDVIDRQIEHLVRLVDDLLDVSRVTRGKLDLRLEPVDLSVVVTRAVEMGRPLVEARRHSLDVALPGRPLRVRGDATRLAQVVLNLLNNAAKYTGAGGHIWLTAAFDPGAGDAAPRAAVIRVRDTGAGIPADMLPRVFDLFTQAESTRERAEGGLGVGLALVKKLVELHGGTVEALSEGGGRGSEFVVRLPLLTGEAPANAERPGPAPGPAQRLARRVLVVDDSKDGAETLAMLLRVTGHEARTAYDGPAALEATEAFRPDVVLCDIDLPGMSGHELARRLRALPGLEALRLVALTGLGTEEDRRQSRAAGFDRHLVKPVELEALREALGCPD